MSYKSPIEIIYGDMTNKLENEVFTVIQNVGINVDKNELIKALQYDRNQYEKGYADAMLNAVPVKHGQWLEDEKTYPGPDLSNYVCSSCKRVGGTWIKGLKPENLFTYCPWCGAKMDGDAKEGDGE